MAYSKGYRIPDNSILRRGTLIIGVPRQETPSDPMQPAADQIERFLEAKHAKATAKQSTSTPSASRESITPTPSENK